MLTASGLVILMSSKAKNFLAQAFKIPLTLNYLVYSILFIFAH